MSWILILILSSGGITTIEMSSSKECNMKGSFILKEFKKIPNMFAATFVCMPKE